AARSAARRHRHLLHPAEEPDGRGDGPAGERQAGAATGMTMRTETMRLLFATTAVLALAGCDRREPPAPPEPTPEASPTQASIIRPEIEVERPEPQLEPLEASVT